MAPTCGVTATDPRNLLLHCGCDNETGMALLWIAPVDTEPAEPSAGVVPATYLCAGVVELPDSGLDVPPARFDLAEMNPTVHDLVGTSGRHHLVVDIIDGTSRRRWFLRDASVVVGQTQTEPGVGWRTPVTVDVEPANATHALDRPNLL